MTAKILSALLLGSVLAVAACTPNPGFMKIDPVQCTDWRLVSGYKYDPWFNWRAFREEICVVGEKKIEVPSYAR